MTSSLVGSEMCIRDRPLEEPLDRDVRLYVHAPANVATCTPSRAASFDPVSYTHLTLPTICSV
eukprot:10035917-Prorocentrum_lima.AAC.1